MRVYRFDYKAFGLPYFIYVSFRNFPRQSTLNRAASFLKAFHFEFCTDAELVAANKHGYRFLPYSQLKTAFKSKQLEHVQTSLRFPTPAPF